MNFPTIWLIGWVIVSILLIVGSYLRTDWSEDTRNSFITKAAVFGIVLWPLFAVLIVGVTIGATIRNFRKMSS